MITENLSTLKIHKLTQAQYDRELEASNIDANALYLTLDDGVNIEVPAKNAWDEYEDIYRYIEEIIEEEPTQSSAIDILSAKIKKLEQMMLMFNNWVESNINATVEEV